MGVSNALRNWIVTILTIFMSLSGLFLALICFNPTPDRPVDLSAGAMYFFIGALCLIFYFIFMWKKNKVLENKSLEGKDADVQYVFQESLSDKFLKWVVSVFAFFFQFSSLTLALICLNTTPDRAAQPQTGLLYFACGALVLGVFVFTVWKNWTNDRK